MVDDALEGTEPSWALLRQTMEQALQSEFPKKRNEHRRYTESLWTYRRTLRSLPEVLLALADLHRQLKQRLVWRTWAAVARQSATARHAQRRKFEQRQQLIDEQLAQAEAKSSRDGSHSLYKVIRSFKTGKPYERVQLRDEQGRFLTMKEERQVLEDYSRDLFGTGLDFQLKGASGSLGITPTEVMDQLRSIKVGKAVPRDCPPIVAWRSLGPEAIQHISQLLNRETQADSMDPKITSSSISWLPKPPKKPDKPASLRPIGVIAPEGKVLAGHLRKRLKPTLQAVMSEVTQFGFVPGRGTEEVICKALTHVDEARERARHMQRQAGRGHGGVTLKGSLTFSVDMSKAFDMVDRRRLRESLELADADPFLIDLVGKLHIQALYDMTANDQAFSIATRRGIKQGCKLAPSLFAFATFLLFRRLGAKCDIAALQKVLTMYADDTLLQMHFDDKAQLQEALQLCDLLLDQLTELGFKVNPEKSALLLQIHGGSAQTTRQGLITAKQGEKFVQLPSGRLIALKSQVTYLGIIISYQDYEMKSLRHRLQASKAALKEVAHAVRNSRAVTEKRRLSIWRITAWASAMYGLHVVGLTPQGLSQLESHMIFQLRFVLRSYSQETHETNQQFVQRNGFKAAKLLVLKRLQQFIKRQRKPGGNNLTLLPFYLPRAEMLYDALSSLTASPKQHITNQQQQHVCTECGSLFSGTGALRRHSQKHHAGACLFPKGPRFNPKKHAKAGAPECIACGHQFRSYFFLRRHIEASTCPRVSLLLQNQDDAEAPVTELEQLHERIKVEALRDPGQTAMNPELQLWLMESCALCGQALAGLQVPVFVLEGFLLLANRHNHCYANSALQILHWVMPAMSAPVLQEAYRASQLARITPEHHVLSAITRGWTFDGSQHDSAEFLSAILLNLPGMQVCSWETRSPMEAGYVVDEEGLSPIFLAAPFAADLQAMINQWSNQKPVHAMITAERFAILALPRYVGAGKNSSPIRLQETLSLPVFEAEGSALSWHSFSLRARVIHIGEETTSGHYRSLIRTATQWFLADDSRPPTVCNLNDPMITGNVYLLLLELQQD
ncbi:LINE-1 retrotransposable element ORF2 protein [Symbiodinium microadriaticum]|uniref:LINE-1 retrotransposable element ORF2 protein n=1 Tax=Symbiodinium microadriaticum TaxID=2951 RepID=A0A1Q9D966_SYMMI|nr:LINE-1 retrotransposable element ORF2 protein [Symbiodinium microadriaticum]